MHTIMVRNVNYALEAGIKFLREKGVERPSRNGPVLVAPDPVTTVYLRPRERVLFCEHRDANPFFHLVEALWMLAGRRDVGLLAPYVARMKDFSDNGVYLHGAYGYRWRKWFVDPAYETTLDQLSWAIGRLSRDHSDRRVIIQMYDAAIDQPYADSGGKDVPCNIVCAPWVDVAGNLSMTVFCRSNDMVWGGYGANAVHFSMLQEYLACGVGVPVGTMYQVSNNFHAYLNTIEKVPHTYERIKNGADEYSSGLAEISPRIFGFGGTDASSRQFDEDLTFFFDDPTAPGIRSHFLRTVAGPLIQSHKAFRNKGDPDRFPHAIEIASQCKGIDWRIATVQWLERRQKEQK